MEENSIIIYKTEDEPVSVAVRFAEDSVRLTMDQMAALFEKGRSTINEHILKCIF